MPVIRYGIAGRPVDHSLSPLLMALVCDHLGLNTNGKNLDMELVDVGTMTDALAWGYAGAIPSQVDWVYTSSVFGKFRTTALLKKAVEAAREAVEPFSSFRSQTTDGPSPQISHDSQGLPTRMFGEEIWLNLTAPLKHQLDSSAVQSVDDAMSTKSVNALRWDGRGWWCGGFDGQGVVDVLHHHGRSPSQHVLGLHGGGGGARSTADAWSKLGGKLTLLESRRTLEDGGWKEALCDEVPDVVVDFDGLAEPHEEGKITMMAAYSPMAGTVEERAAALSSGPLDGRWLLVAQHLVCWRKLWAPERANELPSLGLIMTRLVVAETLLAAYA